MDKEGYRVKHSIELINYTDTKEFFKNRAGKFKENNPYSVTMYQDNNPNLVIERNKYETEKLLPLLSLSAKSKVLDIACGIGRWSDAIKENITEYCGVDFSEELISIAKDRNCCQNRDFLVGSASNLEEVLKQENKGKYNRILLMGILMYLNEEDVEETLRQVERVSESESIVCIREPIGITERLTLKNFYSNELEDNYNAIYRTREEFMRFFEKHLIGKGFHIAQEGFMFSEDALNNRKETAQYYFIFKRGK